MNAKRCGIYVGNSIINLSFKGGWTLPLKNEDIWGVVHGIGSTTWSIFIYYYDRSLLTILSSCSITVNHDGPDCQLLAHHHHYPLIFHRHLIISYSPIIYHYQALLVIIKWATNKPLRTITIHHHILYPIVKDQPSWTITLWKTFTWVIGKSPCY